LLIGIEGAGARNAALHLIKDQHQIMLVAQRAQTGQEFLRGHLDAALALNGLDQETGGVRADRRLRRLQITKVHIFEAGQQGQEALVHLFLVRRADRPQRAAVEGFLEGDQLELVIVADMLVIGTRGLDRAFHRLSA
jgi:type I site-specific restriction-modification system R (restriction) subunit